MEPILRSAVIYLGLVILFRIVGKRTLAQITTFDLVLLLIIGEATQQALLGNDFSVTNAFLVIGTLLGIELVVILLERRFHGLGKVLEGTPVVVVENGVAIEERMNKAHLDVTDVLEQARLSQGIERLDQIKYAVLERSGGISIIPRSGG